MSRATPPAYNESLNRRGSLTIWFNPAMIWDAAPTGKSLELRLQRQVFIRHP